MAKLLSSDVHVAVKATIELTESELRALNGLFGYGVDQFLEVFYAKMGEHYLKPHEQGLRLLHDTIRTITDGPLARLDDARRTLTEAKKPKAS